MPRPTDHDQHERRRAAIADSFCGLVATEGLAAATFARVAERSDMSVGLVQHYVGDRRSMLEHAYAWCLARQAGRIEARTVVGEVDLEPIRTMMATALRELLPLDAARRREHVVTQHLLAQAGHDTGLARLAARADDDLRSRCSTAVRNGVACGEVAPSTDADQAADRILTTVRGLAERLALPGRSSELDVDAVLDPVLDAVFTGRCRRHG